MPSLRAVSSNLPRVRVCIDLFDSNRVAVASAAVAVRAKAGSSPPAAVRNDMTQGGGEGFFRMLKSMQE